MACTHERIKCVNCEKFCLICGAKLPAGNPAPAEAPKEQDAAPKKTTRKKVK